MSKKIIDDFWHELVGSQLSSVEFVQDYLQLRFDGPCLSVTNPLTVKSNIKEITSWDDGFRDLLCEQITKIVRSIQYDAAKALIIAFEDDSLITISLKPEDYTSPEALYAHGFKNNGWLAE